MKHLRKILAGIFFALTSISLVGQVAPPAVTQSAGVDIPKPLYTIAETGKYRAIVEKAAELLEKRELWAFYDIVHDFFKEVKRQQNEEGRHAPDKRYEAIARDWMIYLIVKAPPISTEEYLERVPSSPNPKERGSRDIFLKSDARRMLTEFVTKERLEFHSNIYKIKHGVKMPILFTPKEEEARSILHLNWVIELNNSIRPVVQDVMNAKAKLRYVPTPGYVPPPQPKWDRSKLTNEELEKVRKEYVEVLRKHPPDVAKIKYDNTKQRYETYRWLLNPDDVSFLSQYVRKLRHTFPNDGKKVQEFVRRLGYTSDAECARIIQFAFPKTRRTAYLYEGLEIEYKMGEITPKSAASPKPAPNSQTKR